MNLIVFCVLLVPALFLAMLLWGVSGDQRIRTQQKLLRQQQELDRLHKAARRDQKRKRRRQMKGIRRARKLQKQKDKEND